MRGGGHHRGDLLGGERVVVSRHARALAREVLGEQPQLIPQRAVQMDLPVRAPDHLHALLELLLLARAHRDRERRPQQRRTAGGLQIGEQIPCLLRALIAEVRHALIAVGLGPDDLIGVLDAPARDPQRQPVRQVARVQGEIDPERQALHGREHQLDPRPRERRPLGQRSEHQLRLPADPQLRLDPQPPTLVLDAGVHPAQHLPLQRRQLRLTVALEHERPRLVQPIDPGLAETAAERAPDQPLQLHAARLPDRQVVRQPGVGLVGTVARALQLGHLQQASVVRREGAAELAQPLARTAFRRLGDVGGDIALGVAQADEQEHRGSRRADVAQAAMVRFEVDPVRTRMRVRFAAGFQLVHVALQLPAACDPDDLQVRLDRLDRAEQLQQPCTLAVLAQPQIGGGPHGERRPAVVQTVGEHAVPVHARDRRPHRRTVRSRAPAASAITCPRAGRGRSASSRIVSRARVRARAGTSTRSWATLTSTAPGPV